jgi:hypothetical protein
MLALVRTTRAGPIPEFIGADLTDGTVARPRPADVCGLRREGTGLTAKFWEWTWVGEGLNEIVAELRGCRCAMLDGPQGLAASGRSMRACERFAAAAGKTPDSREKIVRGRPFAGFVLTSLDLFAALDAHGLAISSPEFVGGVGEVYPAHLWRLLSTALGKKTTHVGVAQRSALLAACGVRLPAIPVSHDQLDAAIAALVAAAACGAAPGLTARYLGDPLVRRPDGTLEEGPMVVLDVTSELQGQLRRAVAI